MQVDTSIFIAAPPIEVWGILTDANRLTGATGILRLEGTVQPQARIKLWSDVSPQRAFALRVTRFDPPTTMVWQGGMPLGLFKGTRTFVLTPDPGGTRLAIKEVFTGPLGPMITRSMPNLKPSFEKFAAAIKQMSEAQSA